jgi:thiosulfate reductase cytochrome b subunit
MKQSTKRSILRWIHIVLAIPIAGYVYSPFENIPQYAGPTRYVFFPVLVLTGLWMWKGLAIGRLFVKRSPTAADAA